MGFPLDSICGEMQKPASRSPSRSMKWSADTTRHGQCCLLNLTHTMSPGGNCSLSSQRGIV